MSFCTIEESKEVGWDEDMITVPPTPDEVNAADRLQLLRWYRFCDESAQPVMARISERLFITFPEGGTAEPDPHTPRMVREVAD